MRVWKQIPAEQAETPARVRRSRKTGWNTIKGSDPGSSTQVRLERDLRKAADGSRRMTVSAASERIRAFVAKSENDEPSSPRRLIIDEKVAKDAKRNSGGAFNTHGGAAGVILEVAKGGDARTEKFIGGAGSRLLDDEAA